ncbi:hypothetical protein SDJN03_02652, partial [Cucurbita argyrosperma subsp. sororia]
MQVDLEFNNYFFPLAYTSKIKTTATLPYSLSIGSSFVYTFFLQLSRIRRSPPTGDRRLNAVAACSLEATVVLSTTFFSSYDN